MFAEIDILQIKTNNEIIRNYKKLQIRKLVKLQVTKITKLQKFITIFYFSHYLHEFYMQCRFDSEIRYLTFLYGRFYTVTL